MKKILLIHHYGGIGGAGVSFLHIIDSIDLSKYEVTVVCPKDPEDMVFLLKKRNIKVISLEGMPTIFNYYNGSNFSLFSLHMLKNILDIFLNKKTLKKIIKDSHADIVAVNSMTLCWLGPIIKKYKKIAICFHRETFKDTNMPLGNMYIKRMLSQKFDKVAFISQYDCEVSGAMNAEKKVIYDRIDIDKYQIWTREKARERLNFEKEVKYVLYLGGYSKLKGSEVIFDAFNYINDSNIKLVFIGRLSNSNQYQSDEKIWRDRVLFFDITNEPEIFYKACDVVVFPSTIAHQSRPIYEAGISKIPIVITDFENTKEFAENEVTAFTFQKNNGKSLALVIESIIFNKVNVEKVINNNYEKVLKQHSLSSLPSDLENLFEIN